MTFLQPLVLWGLPLVLLPVLIHLLNRLRHRSQPWAAMRFLIAASRTSVSRARLRQFLVLLFRVLAVLTLVLFLSRPLAGGWLGWALAPAPDAILILLDRSASMETISGDGRTTLREQAVKLLSDAAKEFDGASHLVLIDSARREPQPIANAAALAELSLTSPTDTAADLPALLQTAFNWLVENRAGTAELWIASDLQRSNWLPDDTRWQRLVEQLASLPQKVRVRLLALAAGPALNTRVALREVVRRDTRDRAELRFVVDFERNEQSTEPVLLTVNLEGGRWQTEIPMDGQSMRWRHGRELNARSSGGWGSFELPADANRLDNKAYFTYGAPTPWRASVVSDDAAVGRYLQFAAAVFGQNGPRPAELVRPAAVAEASWQTNTLIVWQADLPDGATAERLRQFVEEGGVVFFFPPGRLGAARFNGVGWGEVQTAPADGGFQIGRWDEDQGPLAKTDEGLSLPLKQTTFARRQMLSGSVGVLAAFSDGAPFLARLEWGRGSAYFCTTLPHPQWSSLGDGLVLVPMLQRALAAGAQRLQQTATLAVGDLGPADLAQSWTCVDSATPKDLRTQAGVYRAGERLIALNRPAIEDEPEVLEATAAQALFDGLPFQMLTDERAERQSLQGEIWRLFLFLMLLCLVVESALILPARPKAATPRVPARPRPFAEPVAAGETRGQRS